MLVDNPYQSPASKFILLRVTAFVNCSIISFTTNGAEYKKSRAVFIFPKIAFGYSKHSPHGASVLKTNDELRTTNEEQIKTLTLVSLA